MNQQVLPGCEELVLEEAPAHNGTKTSREAAESVAPSIARQRAVIFAHLHWLGRDGGTREQIEQDLGMAGNSVRPRVVELMRSGLICERPDTYRRTAKGRRATVLIAVMFKDAP